MIVTGRLRQRSYETKEGDKRTVYELEIDDAGPALSRATAKVTKVSRSGSGQGTDGAEASAPWTRDEPPF